MQLATPATQIEWWSRTNVFVTTSRGRFDARAAIVTVSTNVLTAGKIKFAPELPKRVLDAAAKLKLGSHDHVALEFTGNPLGLRRDELMFEKSESNRTAAVLANVSGSTLCVIDVGGKFGRELSDQGEAAMIEFAVGWLAGLYGTDIKSAVKRSHATRWNHEPWVLGASSAAAPGAQPSRKVLMEPLNNRMFLAGEAAHETLWGTVGGAWESGERAADAVVRPARRQARVKSHYALQHPAGALADLGDDLAGHRLDLLVGQRLLARLQGHGDGDRLLAGIDALALVDVEHVDAGDQLAVGRLRGTHDVGGLHGAVDHEGEVALDRLERRELEHRLGARRLGLRLGDLVQDHLEGDQRAFGVERLERARMQFAEMAEHVLRADLDGAASAPDGTRPGRPAPPAAPAPARRRRRALPARRP